MNVQLRLIIIVQHDSEDGSLYSWGTNDLGQLGTGNLSDAHTPVQIKELEGKRYIV